MQEGVMAFTVIAVVYFMSAARGFCLSVFRVLWDACGMLPLQYGGFVCAEPLT